MHGDLILIIGLTSFLKTFCVHLIDIYSNFAVYPYNSGPDILFNLDVPLRSFMCIKLSAAFSPMPLAAFYLTFDCSSGQHV